METAPTLEMALCSQQQVEAAADPADAEGPQEADSPSPQLLPSIEGDLRQSGKVGMLSSVGGRTSYCPEYTVGVHPPLCAGFKNFKELLLRGKPKPQTTWTHNGSALDNSRVSVRNGEQDSILFIREAQRADSGCYQLCVQLGGLQATATINILVIEKPGPPQSIKLVDVWGSNATLEWTPPQDTGNTALLGYTVQKADKKSGVRPIWEEGREAFWNELLAAPHGLWFTVLEHYHRTSCIVSDLIVGNSYAFRVFAENQCGLSETAPVTADLAYIQKADTVYKTKGFAQRDLSEAPRFTQPLVDCTTITGYDTQLFCCVRASPRPKIIWLKNKMDLQGNPKYRALSHLGICSLEIRKPSPFDGGIYTCKAINALGEASVDCRVDVKESGSCSKFPIIHRGNAVDKLMGKESPTCNLFPAPRSPALSPLAQSSLPPRRKTGPSARTTASPPVPVRPVLAPQPSTSNSQCSSRLQGAAAKSSSRLPVPSAIPRPATRMPLTSRSVPKPGKSTLPPDSLSARKGLPSSAGHRAPVSQRTNLPTPSAPRGRMQPLRKAAVPGPTR
ncbi:myosin binding protein H-like [Cricetulus griseus]